MTTDSALRLLLVTSIVSLTVMLAVYWVATEPYALTFIIGLCLGWWLAAFAPTSDSALFGWLV